jgi:hypothetical protein
VAEMHSRQIFTFDLHVRIVIVYINHAQPINYGNRILGRTTSIHRRFMKFEVYCDESRPDLLGSTKSSAKYMIIGSLWLPSEKRGAFKEQIHGLRDKHRVAGGFKWRKVTPSRIHFYEEIIDWFFSKGNDLRFRCIAVDSKEVNLIKFHNSDQELGFYKFYYQMLHHWILDYNEYSVFCDYKSSRERNRLAVLRRCLQYSNLSAEVTNVQAIRSKESVLLQLADVLTGVVGTSMTGLGSPGTAKRSIISRVERQIGRAVGHTIRDEQKFNVFVINLRGGW